MLATLTKELAAGNSLTDEQIVHAVVQLTGEADSVEIKADFLAALAKKGETADEISAFARALRDLAIVPPIDEKTRAAGILDVCGTGGDRLNTFNISTTVAFVMAAAGVNVAKHGNRAVTSQAGSADVLEALGIKIDLTAEQAAACLREHQFAFLFAPNFHPAFKQIGPVRRLCAERKQRTIFNFLGPLLNPARPSEQLVGVPKRGGCVPIAAVLQKLGVQRGMVVCGSMGGGKFLDEVSILGRTYYAEFSKDGSSVKSFSPRQFPLEHAATLNDLTGGDRETNAGIVRRVLGGEERGPKRDAVLANSAVAMVIAGQSDSYRDGWARSAELIDSGKARQKLEDLIAHSKALQSLTRDKSGSG